MYGNMALIVSEVTGNMRSELDSLLGTFDWNLTFHENNYADSTEFTLLSKKRGSMVRAAEWTLAGMPGCCGMVVSTAASVFSDFRKKGLGTFLNLVRVDIAKRMEYGALMCTDIEKNTPQRKILEKNEWKEIYSFRNPRTNNTVIVSCVDLNEIDGINYKQKPVGDM